MNDSSAPLDYSTTSSNDVGFIAQEITTILPNTVTLTCNAYDTMASSNLITINGNTTSYTTSTSNTVTLDNINASTFSWKNQEFVDCMPDYNRIEKMCKEYPGLAIAFEKFKTTYKLVKDHYDTPEDQRPKP